MTITVKAYRLDTGAHLPHLDAVFSSEVAARADALAKNCRAHTPFFFLVRCQETRDDT